MGPQAAVLAQTLRDANMHASLLRGNVVSFSGRSYYYDAECVAKLTVSSLDRVSS